ncbi:hypothetical protein AB9P05_18730 [Roseivirga sp. BDSF3-8]|uniref:hypothetical protein n=1 Tax=Roseivirga sp. BDSF3-8 TaxID=3241598 RepID=UPI0035318630
MIENSFPNLAAWRQKLLQGGHAKTIQQVSEKINRIRLDSTTRYLLSQEPVYVYLLYQVIQSEGVEDEEGILNRILNNAESLRTDLYELVIEEVINEKKLAIDDDYKSQLLRRIVGKNPPLDTASDHILDELKEVLKVGALPQIVDEYLKNFPEVYFNPSKRKRVAKTMVDKLVEINFDPSRPDQGDQDDKLFYAYSQAMRSAGGSANDPIKGIFGGGHGSFDYNVNYYEDSEAQGIIRENILAAGALFYLNTMGEQLGVFHTVDAILLNSSGSMRSQKLYLPPGEPITGKLYDYFKLREYRTSLDEFRMFSKQVLNLGEASMMENMYVNTTFTNLSEALMQQVVEYIRKSEEKELSTDTISREPIFQIIRDIQYNLTHACSGLVLSIIPEINAQFESAMDILQDKVIVDQLGYGYRKSPWSVIERVMGQQDGNVPNVSAMRTIAVEGHKMFRYFAEFDGSDGYEISFDQFIRSVEAFIIAQSQLEGGGYGNRYPEQEEENLMPSVEENDEWNF